MSGVINNNHGVSGTNASSPSDFRNENDNVSESDQDAFENAMGGDPFDQTGTLVSRSEGNMAIAELLGQTNENGEQKNNTSNLQSLNLNSPR